MQFMFDPVPHLSPVNHISFETVVNAADQNSEILMYRFFTLVRSIGKHYRWHRWEYTCIVSHRVSEKIARRTYVVDAGGCFG